MRASTQHGDHPRPQLLRDAWTDLSGTWQFAHDDDCTGLDRRWQRLGDLEDRSVFERDITVPFPPESPASGVGDSGPHAVVWYRRGLRLADVAGSQAVRDDGHRLLLRFGAVDHAARAWVDGHLVATHTGGQTPWSADLTDVIEPGDLETEHVLVVRAEDDPRDVSQPRGKQDWQDDPHGIWYRRTTGIWQPVWCEVVPPLHVEHLTWTPDVPGRAVALQVDLSAAPATPLALAVRLELDGRLLAEQRVAVEGQHLRTTITLPAMGNAQALPELLWSPEDPHLVDAEVRLEAAAAGSGSVPRVLDATTSYLGLRSVGVASGAFLLNGRPCYLRSVLEQGYWPDTHLAAPSAQALREEVELIKALGFNAVRVHQKAEDPRFLYWADRLGLLVWGETANAYAFTPEAVRALAGEWAELVRRDASHPSIVTWVPLNESWGVHDIATDAAQQAYATGLAALTRALDPSRPVVTNDGWEHTDSDLWTIHDYADTGEVLTERYGSTAAVERLLGGFGPAGRRLRVPGGTERGQPVMLTEFGGIRFTPSASSSPEGAPTTWGYSTARDADDFARRLEDLLSAVHASPVLAGFCYTQLTDTLQEANGLLDERRRPKIPLERLCHIITGHEQSAG